MTSSSVAGAPEWVCFWGYQNESAKNWRPSSEYYFGASGLFESTFRYWLDSSFGWQGYLKIRVDPSRSLTFQPIREKKLENAPINCHRRENMNPKRRWRDRYQVGWRPLLLRMLLDRKVPTDQNYQTHDYKIGINPLRSWSGSWTW